MFDPSDIEVIEGGGGDVADYYDSIQRAINAGNWGLQGSRGRSMMGAIESGACMLGKERASDYYGNIIPARGDVVAGSKGSYEFVVERSGQDWADRVAAI